MSYIVAICCGGESYALGKMFEVWLAEYLGEKTVFLYDRIRYGSDDLHAKLESIFLNARASVGIFGLTSSKILKFEKSLLEQRKRSEEFGPTLIILHGEDATVPDGMLPDASQIRLVTDDWFELALKARENAEKLAQELSVSRDACHQPFTVRRHLRGTLPLFSGDDSATAKPLLNGLESVATLLGAFQQVERAALVVGGLKSLEGVLEAAVDAEGPAPHKVIAPIASAATKMLNQLSNDRLDRLAPPESISEEKLARSLILLVRFWSYLFFHQMPGLASYDYWFTTIAHLFTAKPPTRIDGCLRDQLVSCLSAVSAFIDHLESRFFPPEHIAVAGNGELSDLSIMTAGVTTRVTSNRKGRRASVP